MRPRETRRSRHSQGLRSRDRKERPNRSVWKIVGRASTSWFESHPATVSAGVAKPRFAAAAQFDLAAVLARTALRSLPLLLWRARSMIPAARSVLLNDQACGRSSDVAGAMEIVDSDLGLDC